MFRNVACTNPAHKETAMHKHLTSIIAAGALLIGSSAWAHHPFGAEYDSRKPARLHGVVTRVEWTNPHAFLIVDGRAEGERAEHWRVELGNPGALSNRGWKRRTVRAGDEVTVQGWLARGRQARINARTVTMGSSGAELDAASSFFAARDTDKGPQRSGN
jgi:hypothetical protein